MLGILGPPQPSLMSPHYDHSQPGTVIRVALGGTAAFCLVLGVLPVGSAIRTTLWITGIGMGLVCLLFHSLRVVVDRKEIQAIFGAGLVRFRFPIAAIVDARVVQNRWSHGWGIHLTQDGWVYNVSGYDAVELTKANGKKVRIGTDDPEKLCAAIRKVLASP